MPAVHSKRDKAPPFYDISYQVVSDWDVYETIIESYKDVIVVNTHGEVVPVPSGFGGLSWLDEIAEAMLERHIIWVHIAGYPFYYGWRQGSTEKETWGEGGFKRVMSHINKGDVTIPILSGNEVDTLTTDARNALSSSSCGWDTGNFEEASRDRPLRESDFKSYTILKIWGEQDYYTGAVVAFVKPNERFSPNARNFGAFVHVGTNQIFDLYGNSMDKDYWRAHAGVAAAVWTELSDFRGVTMSSHYDPGDVNFTIHATPSILKYNYWPTSDC